MPKISRDNDLAATGHKCDAVKGIIATCGTVFANGRKVARPGDKLKPHVIKNPAFPPSPPPCIPHKAKINRGSITVFAEGRPVARRGDSADMGSMIGGSPNVFAG